MTLEDYQKKVKSGEIIREKPKNPKEKALANPNSLRAAINHYCWDCSGESKKEVGKCRVTSCPLHKHRPWQNK